MHNVELSDCQDFPRSSRNLRRKNALQWTKNNPAAPARRTIFLQPKLGFLQTQNLEKEGSASFLTIPERRNPTSGARSSMRANTDKKQGKMSRRFETFFSRTAAFACRVFPTRCKLTREPGCVGKMTTSATTCNSWFAGGFPHLTGIFTGKTHKNSSST